jgi:ribosomal protein S18 acetylase RimI-like enzyme
VKATDNVDLTIRPLGAADQALLWDWLHLALWDPPPAPQRPREVLRNPAVSIYAEGWGREGDVGVAGIVDGKPIGACWMRRIRGGVGMGYVDDDTPQLGIALEPEYRGRGFGRRLMRAAFDAARAHGYRQVSLTVHPQNPAIALYESCGFEKREIRSTYHLMVATLMR